MRAPSTMSWRGPRRVQLLLLALLTLAAGSVSRAQPPKASPAAVSLGAGSVLWLEGTSTVHDYESRTSKLGFTLLRDAGQADPTDAAGLDKWLRSGGLRGLDLVVPLQSMRSGKAALDKNLLKALRATEFPEIRFQLTSSKVGTARGDTLPVTAAGTLRVAGQERPISVRGWLVRGDQGLWLEGSHPMKMSEHGVKPPTMMLGTLKVRDPIVVRYRLLLIPGDANAQKDASHN